MVWYEPASNLGEGLVQDYEAAEAAADAAAEQEEAELEALEAEAAGDSS